MTTPQSTPQAPRKLTGKEMMQYLRGLEIIRAQMRNITLDAMVNPRQTLASRVHWGIDLKRGRTNVYGGLFRFLDVLAVRAGKDGRAYALVMLGLLRSYVDAVMPEQDAKPAAETMRSQPRLQA